MWGEKVTHLTLGPLLKRSIWRGFGEQQNEGDLDWCWVEEAFTPLPVESWPAQESVDVARWHTCDMLSWSYSSRWPPPLERVTNWEDSPIQERRNDAQLLCHGLIWLEITPAVCAGLLDLMWCLSTCSCFLLDLFFQEDFHISLEHRPVGVEFIVCWFVVMRCGFRRFNMCV